MKKGLFYGLIFVLMLSMALVGCGSATESGGESGDTGDSSDQTEGNTEDENTTAKDMLIFGRGNDSTSLDPSTITDGESLAVTKNIYDTLVDYGEQDTTIHEMLAVDWDVSDDGLTYTFQLREGVKFHDGTDFNAEAVKFNFDRWKEGDAETAPYYVSMFGEGEDSVIKEVKAEDELTVVFTLNRPQAPFLQNIAMDPFGIASPTAVKEQGEAFGQNPVGTGAYVFKEWKPNETITLEKNPDYWDEGKPELNTVIFQVIPDNAARLTALKTGEIDLMDGLNPSDIEGIEASEDLQIILRPPMNVGYLGFNVETAPFDDPKVRQALNHAVDKQSIIDSFYAGNADPAVNPMPDVIPGYNDEIEPYAHDPEKAKELLAEAGYEDGFDMTLWAMPNPRPYMPEPQKIAEAIQAQFANVGVNAEVKTMEWATYLDKAAKGELEAFMLGWTGDNGDADNFLYALLDKESIGSNNYSYYANDKLHDILIEAQSEPDQDKRSELYKEAQVIIHEDAPWIPLVYAKPALAASASLKDFKPHPTGSDRFRDAHFE